MSPSYPFRPIPGQFGPHKRGPYPAPPFNPQDYWATRKLVSSLFGTLDTTKLDKVDVVDPSTATEDGKAAEAKSTYKELTRISGVASDALVLAESKADKLSSQQLAAVNSGIDADKVAKIAQNESEISSEVSRATTEEARLRVLISAIKTFEVVVADSLPSPSEQYSKKLYLIPSTNPETRNVKDEFICVKVDNVWGWEQVGSTAITIEFDNEPTEGSQKAVRSGGIWSAIWGMLSELPAGFTSIYDWVMFKLYDKADKSELEDSVGALSNIMDGKLDKSDVVAPSAVSRSGQAADAVTVRSELDSILRLAEQAARDANTAAYDVQEVKSDLEGVKITAEDLEKNKVGSFQSVGGASATVGNGVANLSDFFTASNSLLTATIDARLPYPLYAVPSTGLLKDRAINTTSLATVTVPDNFTDLLVRASVASSLSVTMPEAIATKYGDTFPGEAGEYLITITKTGAAEAYVRTIKLEEVA